MVGKKVIIVEFYGSHSEVLYTSMEIFRMSGYDVHLWLNEDCRINEDLIPNVTVNFHKSNSHSSRITFIVDLIRYIKKNEIGKVFINTADGLQVRNFCMASMPFKFEVSGVLHIAERLLKSTTQKIISRKLKKYFVLSHYILKNVQALNIRGLEFEVFYPLIINYSVQKIKKISETIVLSIPGEISPYRKSYFGFLEILRKHKDEIPNNIKFELLGTVRIKEGDAVIDRIDEYGLKEYFILYDKFIPDSKYYERCELADAIMPLIHTDVPNYGNYLKYQVSGAYDIAYTFHKPLLMHRSFEELEDFQGIGLFYDEDDLIEVLKKISKDKMLLNKYSENYKSMSKFDFETQRKQFMQLIEA